MEAAVGRDFFEEEAFLIPQVTADRSPAQQVPGQQMLHFGQAAALERHRPPGLYQLIPLDAAGTGFGTGAAQETVGEQVLHARTQMQAPG